MELVDGDELGDLCEIELRYALCCPCFPDDIFSVRAATKDGKATVIQSSEGFWIWSHVGAARLAFSNCQWCKGYINHLLADFDAVPDRK